MKFLLHQFVLSRINDKHFSEHTAFEQGNLKISYEKLGNWIKSAALYLQKIETPRQTPIGILSSVTAEAAAIMVAALESGKIYIPLNINAPLKWIGQIVQRAGIKTIFVDPRYAANGIGLRAYGVTKIIFTRPMNAEVNSLAQGVENIMSFQDIQNAYSSGELVKLNLLADDVAYILFTSGSTGDPKGVLITHRNAYTFTEWMRQEFKVVSSDRVFNRAPLQFDLSVFDIFTTLTAGGTVVIFPDELKETPQNILSYMREKRVNIIYTVPSAYIRLLTKGDLQNGLPSLRLVLYAGEPFPVPYLKRFMACLPNIQVSNIYGPTETNIVTYFHMTVPPTSEDSIPIGWPVFDTEAFIVDDNNELVKDGDIGEILIRGGTVFAGYFNDRILTEKKLIQSPFHNYPTLCCKTGDYGRYLPDGSIAYHGRMDSMVKVKGYRVELGEVEQAISSFPTVDEIAVIPLADEKYGNILYAFIATQNKNLKKDEISRYLTETIPSYMVPFEFYFSDVLPKTATGKIDRVGLKKKILYEGAIK